MYTLSMIRTQDIVPEWVYQFVGIVPELKENALTAKPLVETVRVDVDASTELEEVWSDGRFGDPYKPLGYVPFRENKKVRVVYHDYSDHGYYLSGSELKFQRPQSYGYVDCQLVADSWPAFEYPMEWNQAYHDFNCLELEIFMVKGEGKTDIVYLLFQDIQDRQWYITRSWMMGLKQGSYKRR